MVHHLIENSSHEREDAPEKTRLTVRLSPPILSQADRLCQQLGLSRNGLITLGLIDVMDKYKLADEQE